MTGPPLWVVERGDARVYIFGVRPLMGPTPWLTPPVEAALGESEAFWRETPPVEVLANDPLVAEHGLSSDVTLRARLDDATYARVESVASGAGLDPETLQIFRPWLAGQVLRAAVYTPIYTGPTMDDILTDKAVELGQTIDYEFPDAESIIRLFSDLPEDVEADLLRMELDWLEPGPDAIRHRFERATAGDLSIEEEDATRVAAAYPELYRRLLTDRNRAWIPRIDTALEAKTTTFIAPGTMHLVGPDNVRALLGDRIRQIA